MRIQASKFLQLLQRSLNPYLFLDVFGNMQSKETTKHSGILFLPVVGYSCRFILGLLLYKAFIYKF